jgi:hypothetical protein
MSEGLEDGKDKLQLQIADGKLLMASADRHTCGVSLGAFAANDKQGANRLGNFN